ncbi:protoporphyrinogen oxidase HemJ [Pseudobacteriovorax antillogorgiicola]|uniref:Protoporphyrinogen IX oxidase n=1 Tax=Pseudobacteriovorax antillogorgiicola TaxID=1513793 RepID=A0A1Y6C7G0_9BACT|nr:protoporphyrinogen oxidase HemJ [Pseudobacteriovorax antillogorgiicola]TCS50727.1 putative membrane protein [Pseudobacteriovorax antillogorgiicola]SMF40869.1 putative membrane protein [Pseudobacteriovorax antillogorgiicola]
MIEWYREILALHVVAIISWMAGILYLYRLLVYAAESSKDHEKVESLLQIMSRRLLKAITLPAMVVSWIAGLTMISINPGLLSMPWMHVKLTSVVLLSGFTMYAGKQVRLFNEGKPILSGKAFRFLNEAPTLLMIIIVIMVIVRPWA